MTERKPDPIPTADPSHVHIYVDRVAVRLAIHPNVMIVVHDKYGEAVAWLTPEQAREKASELLTAANQAEGHTTTEEPS